MPDIEFPTGAGTAPGYLAVPAGEHGPAVIVLQEWWGLDSHIRSVCDRLAADGFFALAPNLFRGEPTTQPSEAEQKMMAMSMEQAELDMCGAAGFLSSHAGVEGSGVGALGFCLGGGLVAVGRRCLPADHRGRDLLLRDAPRQARLRRHQRPRARALRHRRCVHRDRGSGGARVGTAGRRRGRRLPVLRGRRPRLLQRRQPPRHLRPGPRRELVGAQRELPARRPGPPGS